MTLFQSSLITGFIIMFFGIAIARPSSKLRSSMLGFPRSELCSYWLVGIATIWFLWRHVAFLSEADFGNYKVLIGAITIGTAGLSFVFAADFLAVRGLAMVILLWSREVLNSAFLHEAGSRLFLVSVVYTLIIFSIYFGAWPYKLRDFIEWLNRKTSRITTLSWVFSWAGLAIITLSFTF